MDHKKVSAFRDGCIFRTGDRVQVRWTKSDTDVFAPAAEGTYGTVAAVSNIDGDPVYDIVLDDGSRCAAAQFGLRACRA